MSASPEEIGAKMDALGLWDILEPYNWAIKPRGTAFPYFCTILKHNQQPVKVRLLMLEGWQTLHDYVRLRIDRNFGCHSLPMEFAHFELVILTSGEMKVFRHDPGYMPREIDPGQRPLVAKLLWEAYGVMLRVESNLELPLSFAGERAVFARVEVQDGVWQDSPLAIPDPPPYVEKVSFEKSELEKARDLVVVPDLAWELDFRLLPGLMTKEPRPRSVYALKVWDARAGSLIVDRRVSMAPEGGLKALWEQMPTQLLKEMVARGVIPGEIRTMSGRVFRMLRPLGTELPFKLSMHATLPAVEAAFNN